jgi:hypothetical protein
MSRVSGSLCLQQNVFRHGSLDKSVRELETILELQGSAAGQLGVVGG